MEHDGTSITGLARAFREAGKGRPRPSLRKQRAGRLTPRLPRRSRRKASGGTQRGLGESAGRAGEAPAGGAREVAQLSALAAVSASFFGFSASQVFTGEVEVSAARHGSFTGDDDGGLGEEGHCRGWFGHGQAEFVRICAGLRKKWHELQGGGIAGLAAKLP